MKLEAINETVFQALTPEVQKTLIETSQAAESNDYIIVGMAAITIIALVLGMLLID